MNYKPLISVIIPAFNVEDYISDTLKSVINQSYTYLEIIIINDGSTDSTLSICEKFANEDKRISIHSFNNSGLAMARNNGISVAKGEWYTFVDGDDIIHPQYISTLLNSIKDNSLLATVGFYYFKDTANFRKAEDKNYYLSPQLYIEKMLYQTSLMDGINCSMWGKLYHNSLFNNRVLTPGILYEDLDITYKFLLDSNLVSCNYSPLYFYRKRSGSIINTFNDKRLVALDICQDIINYPSVKDNLLLLKAAEDRLLSASFNMLLLLLKYNKKDKPNIARCWNNIKKLRMQSLLNRKVRIKNKLGIILSYLGGKNFFRLINF
jgi:glycosyltransferase involved in cell wall biosynthesis